jgi:hypothetical protein
MERVTAQETPDGESDASPKPVPLDGLARVDGAGRLEATGGGEKGGYRLLVKREQLDRYAGARAPRAQGEAPRWARPSARRTAD